MSEWTTWRRHIQEIINCSYNDSYLILERMHPQLLDLCDECFNKLAKNTWKIVLEERQAEESG